MDTQYCYWCYSNFDSGYKSPSEGAMLAILLQFSSVIDHLVVMSNIKKESFIMNESIIKTLAVAFSVCLVCSLVFRICG